MRVDFATIGGIVAGFFVVGLAIAMGGAVGVFFQPAKRPYRARRRHFGNRVALFPLTRSSSHFAPARVSPFSTTIARRASFSKM